MVYLPFLPLFSVGCFLSNRNALLVYKDGKASSLQASSSPKKVSTKSLTRISRKSKKVKQKPKEQTNVPNLNAQLDYARNGHCVMRSCVSPKLLDTLKESIAIYSNEKELAAWKQKVQVAANDPQLARSCKSVQDCRLALENLFGEVIELPFLQYFNLWRDIPALKNLANDLAPVAGKLMDVDSVRLYQDALFHKRFGDGPTPWHVDARMAPFDTSNFVTLWIPLQPIPQDGTGLIFCPKSHNDFALPYWNRLEDAKKDANSPWNKLESRYPSETVDHMPLAKGDVTAHNGWTLHCANPNEGSGDRWAVAISYVDGRAPIRQNALDASITDNEDLWSYQDWVQQVPARKPSFDHPLAPILWKK